MSIDFICGQCKTELEADEPDIGKTVRCPVCRNLMKVPVQSAPRIQHSTQPSDQKHKVVVHIPSTQTLAEMTAKGLRQTQSGTVAAPQSQDSWKVQIAVGWICLIVGIVLEVLLPRVFFAYLPFFIGSFAMSIVLLANRRILHALILLLCAGITAPLLMQQNVWKNVGGSASQGTAPVSKEKKLVFDAHGKPAVVSSSEAPVATVSTPLPSRQATALPAPRPSEKKPAATPGEPATVKKTPAVPAADLPAQPRRATRQPPEDPYKKLIENAEEIPPLIPEEELENTQVGHDSNFVWQEKSILDPLGPGDPAPVVEVPFVVYSENGRTETYSATGRLGDKNDLQFDLGWDLAPHSGTTCIYVRYEDDDGWVTVAWQHPGNNWGDYPGGFDLSKAGKLTFWAKGEDGSEKVEFMVGMEQAQNAVSRDSLRATTGTIRLQKEWKKYSISLKDLDRSRIITGFLFRIEGQGKPVVFCLDDIQFE